MDTVLATSILLVAFNLYPYQEHKAPMPTFANVNKYLVVTARKSEYRAQNSEAGQRCEVKLKCYDRTTDHGGDKQDR